MLKLLISFKGLLLPLFPVYILLVLCNGVTAVSKRMSGSALVQIKVKEYVNYFWCFMAGKSVTFLFYFMKHAINYQLNNESLNNFIIVKTDKSAKISDIVICFSFFFIINRYVGLQLHIIVSCICSTFNNSISLFHACALSSFKRLLPL